MWMSSLVLTIQLLGYLILTHTHVQLKDELLGGFNMLLQSWKMMEFVNGKDDNPYIMEHKKWLKQPTCEKMSLNIGYIG